MFLRGMLRRGEEGSEMPFMDYLKKAWEIIKLDKEVIAEMAADEKGIGPAIGVVAISGVCWAIGALQPLGIIYLPIVRVIGFFIFTGIVHFVATTFLGGKGDFKSFVTPAGLAIMVTWVSIVPLLGVALGALAGLWALVPVVLSAEHVYQIDRGKAIIAVAAPIVIFMILGAVFMMVGLSMWALLGRVKFTPPRFVDGGPRYTGRRAPLTLPGPTGPACYGESLVRA
jgi:hypothetical protein